MADCDLPSYPEALQMFAKYKRIPLSAQLELTPRCNFNCRMCYIHMDDKHARELGRELTTDEWLRICQEAKDAGTLYLTLTGGEIFTRPDFQELYTKLSEMGFLITLMTNASLIDEKVMAWLRKRPPYMIRITLYGSNDDVYRSVCQIENGFSRVNKALDLLQEANIPITLKSVIIKNNAGDIENMHRYAFNRKLFLQSVLGIVKPVRGAVSEAEDVRFEPWADEVFPSDAKSYRKKSFNGRGPYQHHPNYLDDCGCYGHTFNVTWDGHMLLCSFMDKPFIDLRTRPVAEAWKQLLEKLEEVKKPAECIDCKYEEYCTRCPGSLSAETGSYNSVSSPYCERAKRLYRLYNSN